MQIRFCMVLATILWPVSGDCLRAQARAKPVPAEKSRPVKKPTDGTTADSSKFLVKEFSIVRSIASGDTCDGLLPSSENQGLTAADIVELIGDPAPFSLSARGPRNILVYGSHRTADDAAKDKELLDHIKVEIDALAKEGKFAVELSIPHAWALADLGGTVSGLNYSDFSIDAIGSDKIRVSADGVPECADWRRFLTDIRSLAWRPYSVQPVDKVFYLDGSAVASALSAGVSGGSTTDTPSKATPTKSAGAGVSKTASAPDTSKASPDSSSGAAADSKKKKASDPPAAPTPAAGPPLAVSDVLIFPEPTPGDDAAVDEKRRIVSMLDLPRPEMIVNVWSMQISSANQDAVTQSTQGFREDVSSYNDRLQKGIARGWDAMKNYFASHPDQFDEQFYRYIVLRHVGEAGKPDDGQQAAVERFKTRSEDFLNYRNGVSLDDATRTAWGVCRADEYCLGYTELVNPLKPRLMDLLLALSFARNPAEVMNLGLNAMENADKSPPRTDSCQDADADAYNDRSSGRGPFFRCFREKAEVYLGASTDAPSPIGLLRSALADFLFNYKMAIEFPHEFSPYELDLSAQSLNTALSPMIDAFNRDIAIYQLQLMSAPSKWKERGKWTESDQATFENTGSVTVRTVSGKETIVDTATQSYLDVTKAPTIPELLSSISAAEGKTPAVIGNNLSASAAAALVGALNTTQSTEAKLGRGLKIDLMPRALPGASAAEIDVAMNVDETAEPTLYTAGQSSTSNDNLSRVAKHDTTTKIRVDSLRIFDISSFAAKLQRSRARFPLLPLPGLEVPYIGTLVGIPRKPAVEYHSSIAVLSAIVVPTAADLAYGTRFENDKVVQAETTRVCSVDKLTGCTFRDPRSMSDLGNIREYHRAKLSCFATGRLYPVRAKDASGSCENVTLSSVPTDAN